MTGKILCALAALSFLTACDMFGGYYDPPDPELSTIAALPAAELDTRIATALAAPPEAPRTPILIAVASTGAYSEKLLPREDEDPQDHWLVALRESGLVSIGKEIWASSDDRLEDILARAANSPAEALLVVNERVDARDSGTPLGLLYPTIVGLAISPGSYRERTVILDATLWDPRAGRPYFSITATGSDWTLGSLFWVERYDVTDTARREARRLLAARLIEKLSE